MLANYAQLSDKILFIAWKHSFQSVKSNLHICFTPYAERNQKPLHFYMVTVKVEALYIKNEWKYNFRIKKIEDNTANEIANERCRIFNFSSITTLNRTEPLRFKFQNHSLVSAI